MHYSYYLKIYKQELYNVNKFEDAREESYYAVLKSFLENIAKHLHLDIQITILPKKTEGGYPDFRVWDGSYNVIGYIEAKDLNKNLDQIEYSEQIKRYKETFSNFILTNFFEFRLYRNGNLLKVIRLSEEDEKFIEFFEEFLFYKTPTFSNAQELAKHLAKKTKFLKEHLLEEIKEKQSDIYGFFEAFKDYLISDLKEEQFADLYAQTITYGLFTARNYTNGNFNRKMAYEFIPSTIGILRDIFHFISLKELPKQMEVIIDDISAILNATDIKSILNAQYFDPILHFYETFLAEYDPQNREKRGVYYTPIPIVHYIVRAVHYFLKNRFGLSDGLADKSVTILDPAAGTLTFIIYAIELAFEEFINKYGEGVKKEFKKHILEHFYAFELLMAPYVIGHIKIAHLLEKLGIPLEKNEKFQFYLTNTLEMTDLKQTQIPLLSSLSKESESASKIKRDIPILVILGNPPYSGISANKNKWIDELLKTDKDGAQSYYKVDGKDLKERKVWLQDDYVKFLRFAQWKIHKSGKGIVAMITNHGYLDNPTFRGMRQSLLKTFDEIYVLDLHGNVKKKEMDENVFDIQQGVAIGIFIKHNNEKYKGVYHLDLYGTREEKYKWLEEHNIETAGYKKINPQSPYYFFIPRKEKNLEYYNFQKITEIFKVYVTGIVTARDELCIDFDKNNLISKIETFRNPNASNEEIKNYLSKLLKRDKVENYAWRVEEARKKLQNLKNLERYIIPILYRPFDQRYIFYHDAVVWRTRYEVMRHMLGGENVGLITSRIIKGGNYQHTFVTKNIIDGALLASNTTSSSYLFPLYLYPSEKEPQIHQKEKEPNINEKILKEFKEFTPDEIFAYIYAILYSPTYRKNYEEELRIDFPRIPFTKNKEFFKEMSKLGKRLIDIHLLRSPELNPPVVKYKGEGDDVIKRVKYDYRLYRIYINEGQFFDGISEEMWNYHIGGYKVLEKYLKERKGRIMDDPIKFIQICTAIYKTIEIQKEIDNLYNLLIKSL
ncbi:MAG: type ISP restriction/modification enzyme [Candidatus Hydrothermia bacterium]|jgi:predicted helicase